MRKLTSCSEAMAKYLWKKWQNGDITEEQIRSLFTIEAGSDVIGGWFTDFWYDSIMS